MTTMDQWVLTAFYGIGACAGLIACTLIVLVGVVFCVQIPWWLFKQTDAWIRISKILRKSARLRKRWADNAPADGSAVADTVRRVVGNSDSGGH